MVTSTTDYPARNRLGQGHHHDVVSHIEIGFGDNQATFAHRLLIPTTRARVVTIAVDGGIGVIHLAAALTEIGELETAGDLCLLQGIEGVGTGLAAERLDHVATGCEPVADTLGLLGTQPLQLLLAALQQQGLLAAIALPGEQQNHQRKGDHH